MTCRSLRVLVAVFGLSLGSHELNGQSAVSDVAVVDLCPMPVFVPASRDTILTFMPDPGIEYMIRVVPATCRNSLEPDSVDGYYAVDRRITRYGPFRVTGEQAQALRRWIIERRDSAESAPNSRQQRRQ